MFQLLKVDTAYLAPSSGVGSAEPVSGFRGLCVLLLAPKGGGCMQSFDIDIDRFVSWLCLREHEVVGCLGTWYDSPLARYLSERTGHVFGVDGKRYGRPSSDYRRWLLLPQWAEAFSSLVESCPCRPVTGYETLLLLAHVELALSPLAARLSPSRHVL